jgi:DNA-binding CsgD family transcriptional regulator
VACFIGVADSLVALTTAVLARPDPVSIVLGLGWVAAWAAALASAPRWPAPVAAHAWLLAPLGFVALAPALLDGGYPGNLATQPMWITLVAAALAGWRATLATGATLALGKLAVFLATGTSLAVLRPGADEPTEATTAILAPLAIALLGLVGVAALRRVLAAVDEAPSEPAGVSPPPASREVRPQAAGASLPALARAGAVSAPERARLSPAEGAVVALLAEGLTPKQIAHLRGTSLATVRTQIKRAKRTTQARTLDELVASGWRPS